MVCVATKCKQCKIKHKKKPVWGLLRYCSEMSTLKSTILGSVTSINSICGIMLIFIKIKQDLNMKLDFFKYITQFFIHIKCTFYIVKMMYNQMHYILK